jgi:hypothetical protein
MPNDYFSSTLTLKKDHERGERVSIFKEANFFESRNSFDYSDNLNFKKKPENNFCKFLKHKIYIFSSLALASLFFIITAVQYWGSDYMETALGVTDKNYRLLSFSIVCITSPTLGVILGGFIITKFGGYESKHSILICLVFATLAGIFSIPVPLMDDLIGFTTFLWFVLFFGGAIVPPITGILISTLPLNLRGSANSMTSLISNLFGYLPAPYFYGVINEHFKDKNKKLAFMCIMYYSFFGVILLLISTIYRYKAFKLQEESNLPISHLINDESRRMSSKYLSSRGSNVSSSLAMVFGGKFVEYDDAAAPRLEQPSIDELQNEGKIQNKIDEEVKEDSDSSNSHKDDNETPCFNLLAKTNNSRVNTENDKTSEQKETPKFEEFTSEPNKYQSFEDNLKTNEDYLNAKEALNKNNDVNLNSI